jgi:DNA-binding NtrC family response regulator
MSALIIEDDEFKTERLRSFLINEAPHLEIELARSYKSGLRALVDRPRPLVLLDMTLPTFDIQSGAHGGRPLSLAGRELLRQMKRRSITSPTAVVTGFDTFGSGLEAVTLAQLDADLREEFGTFYLGCVYFNATTDDWRDQLLELVRGPLTGEIL